jgi:hypothetical protein
MNGKAAVGKPTRLQGDRVAQPDRFEDVDLAPITEGFPADLRPERARSERGTTSAVHVFDQSLVPDPTDLPDGDEPRQAIERP